MRRRTTSTLTFAEKDFYLDEFHEKSLLFVVRASDLTPEADLTAAFEVFATLLKNETQLLLLVEAANTDSEQRRVRTLYKQLARVAKVTAPALLVLPTDGSDDDLLLSLWSVLRGSEVAMGLWPTDATDPLISIAERIAVRLRVYKVVFIDPAGGISTGGKSLSFMNGPVLRELLRPGEAEWAGVGSRRSLLEAVCHVLEGGVSSVTVCPLVGLGRELFTYEGDGTLFTLTDYCQVEKLGIDDFHEVEQLLQRGEREGYLKPRSPQETTLLLLHGYGARVGPAPGELAGFCALLPYPEDRTAEIVGLSTITRYQGEGIGGRLVDQMLIEAAQQQLAYIFACTTQEGAQRLFERHGFCRVPPEEVAEKKWQDYSPERKQQVAVFRRNLSGDVPQ